MKSKYIEGLSLDQRLAHVQEEAGELIAAIGKTQRWGPYSVNPEIPIREREYNISWVLREWDDLQMAMSRYLKDFAEKEDKNDVVGHYLTKNSVISDCLDEVENGDD